MYLLEFNCIIVFLVGVVECLITAGEEKTLPPNLHGERTAMQQS